jgi:hypothetical protein
MLTLVKKALLIGCSLGAVACSIQPEATGTITSAIEDDKSLPRVHKEGGETTLGTTGFTANGRIKPDGRPTTYHVEYGPTTSYGSTTEEKSLPPRLVAHYREDWDSGPNGWFAGVTSTHLTHEAAGGDPGGYVLYDDHKGGDDDTNHYDGIGLIHLAQWTYSGTAIGFPSLFLGGGDPDFRDARVDVSVRGMQWQGNGSELVFWTQSDILLPQQNTSNDRRANWAHTGFSLSDALGFGTWQTVSYQLENDSRMWTYAGRYGNRPTYSYWALDDSLAHINTDMFHNLVFVRLDNEPSGSIGFDNLEITYRNHSLLIPSNGATLVSSPAGSKPDTLTDGWRNGAGHLWKSALDPSGPLEFEYSLANPVSVFAVQIHQNLEWPSNEIEVLVSNDGSSWTSLKDPLEPTWTLPGSSELGPNHAFFYKRKLDDQAVPLPLHSGNISHVKIRILSGYGARWGLGEIELFGNGASMGTDEDWYNVSQDVIGLTPGQTYHYRFVATTDGAQHVGPDRTFDVPNGDHPLAKTAKAIRVHDGSATLTGEMNALGIPTRFYFELGEDTNYNVAIPGPGVYAEWGGVYEYPRPATRDVTGLVSGKTYHFRLVVATLDFDLTYGDDATFVAQ